MRKLFGCATLVLAFLTITPELMAQEIGPQEGQRSISFWLRGDSEGSFGVWTMRSDRTNLGLVGRLDYQRASSDASDTNSTRTTLELAPTLRQYTGRFGPVLPYLQGGVGLGYSSISSQDASGISVSARGGFGVEWFPVSNVGIGGYTGLELGYARGKTGPSDFRVTSNTFRISTMTSALSVQLYFGGKRAPQPVATP